MSTGREIRLVENDDGWWTSIDEETGVASQGKTRDEALDNLDEAVALYRGEIGEDIDNEEAFFHELGFDDEEITEIRDRPDELPEFMR